MRMLFGLFGVASLLAAVSVAGAAVSVEVQSETITGSVSGVTNGFFDVYVAVTGTGNPDLAGWQTQVDLNTSAGQPTGLSFATPTITDGVVSPRTMALDTDSNFTTPNGVLTNTSSEVSATQFVFSGSEPLDSENGDGLMRVPFTLAADAQGTFLISLSTDPNTGTVLANNLGGSISYTPVNGSITVSVPEPTALTLLVMAPLALARRRRRAAAATV